MFTRTIALVFSGFVALLSASEAKAQTTWYVDDDNCPGPGSGTLGDPFCTIQDGIAAAQSGDTVEVADGTYTGAQNKNLDFGGLELTVRSENGPENCVIDCEGAGRGFHLHSGEGPAAAIEGFTIVDGHENHGGGLYITWSSNPTVVNCMVMNNAAENSGGGICVLDASPTITDCVFTGNTTGDQGGALYFGASASDLSNCTFADNAAGSNGGGICSYDSNLTLTDCTFQGNQAAGMSGGGMFNTYSPPPASSDRSNGAAQGCRSPRGASGLDYNATLINCRFFDNSAVDLGGAVYNEGAMSFPVITTLINCTFVGNSAFFGGASADTSGGLTLTNCTLVDNRAANGDALYCTSSAMVWVTNCILWNGGGDEVLDVSGANILLTYSDVAGGYPGEGNIDANPLFARDPDPGPDGEWDGVDDDYGDLHLQAGSPAIDAGDNGVVPPTVTTDLGGGPRFVDDPGTPDTGDGLPPIVDLGAYEFQQAIPAVSGWGLIVLTLAGLTAGTITFARRRRSATGW